MPFFAGIDLHSSNSWICVADQGDTVRCERRVPNRLDAILTLLEPWRAELAAVAVESTFNWYWLVDGLQAAGYTVKLANTYAAKQYDGLKFSDDRHDARWLAHLLRLGILPTGYICPPARREIRDLVRRRARLVRARTAQLLAVHNLVARDQGLMLTGAALKRFCRDQIDKCVDGAKALALDSTLAVIAAFDEQIDRLEASLRKLTKSQHGRELALLCSVPGIGEILSLTILTETGEISRFADAGSYASYARCVRTERLSNGRKKGEGNRRNGSPYLSWAFTEAAHFAVQFQPEAKRFYERKKAKTNGIVAIRALAHKLARAVFFILRDGVPYDAARLFR